MCRHQASAGTNPGTALSLLLFGGVVVVVQSVHAICSTLYKLVT